MGQEWGDGEGGEGERETPGLRERGGPGWFVGTNACSWGEPEGELTF